MLGCLVRAPGSPKAAGRPGRQARSVPRSADDVAIGVFQRLAPAAGQKVIGVETPELPNGRGPRGEDGSRVQKRGIRAIDCLRNWPPGRWKVAACSWASPRSSATAFSCGGAEEAHPFFLKKRSGRAGRQDVWTHWRAENWRVARTFGHTSIRLRVARRTGRLTSGRLAAKVATRRPVRSGSRRRLGSVLPAASLK